MKKLLMLLVVLLAMALCVPAQAAAHGTHYICGEKTCTHAGTAHSGNMPQWTAWDGQSFTTNSTVYCYLTKNIEVSSTITVPQGAHVYLCLNGYNITQKTSNEHVFTVYGYNGNQGELVICDCSSKAGVISHSKAGKGHGVYVGHIGNFSLYNGTIMNNYAGVHTYGSSATITLKGGSIEKNQYYGVHLQSSSSVLNMYGGAIENNYNTGVLVSGSYADMTMQGGKITDNVTGITMMEDTATVTMSGGTISNNLGELGGGVYIGWGTFTLSGGKITNNIAESGGGVYAAGGVFTQTGGSIASNQTSGGIGSGNNSYVGYGGGVFLSSGKYTLSGGSIANNRATAYGGGIYVHNKDCLTIAGGEITGNNARTSGGGVYADVYVDDLYISGSGAKITGNSVGGWYNSNEVTQQYANNIHLTKSNQRVELAPSVTSGEFGVTCAGVTSYPHSFVYCTGSSSNVDEKRLSMFTPDDPGLSTRLSTGTPVTGVLVQKTAHTHKLCGTGSNAECTHALDRHYNAETWSAWDGTYKPVLKSGNNYLYLTKDNADATEIQVEAGQTLYLCLNGHNLIRPGNNLVTVSIYSGGQMILCDCADSDAQGMISNNYANEAMLVSNYGTFTMYGGSLANSTGSGIVCEDKNAVVNLFGGKIANNVGGYAGNGFGCGIYMRDGTLNMYGGAISGNSAERASGKGGGVYLGYSFASDATMNMFGGTITGNSLTGSDSVGGGIYVAPCGILNLYGGTITGNTAATAGGVKMDTGSNYHSQLFVQGNVTIINNNGGNLDIQNPFARTGVVTGNIGLTLPRTPTEKAPVNFAHSCTGMTDEELARFVSDQGYTNKRVNGDYAQFYVPVTKYELTTGVNPSEGGTVTGAGSYAAGATVSLSAEANAGYKFTGWEVVSGSLMLTDDQKKSETISITMPAGALSVRANFARATVTIKAETTQFMYSGVISIAGREDARSHEFTVEYGTELTLTAIPDTGYYANGWQVVNGSMVENDAAYTFVATEDIALKAYIAPNEYRFVIKASPANGGSAVDADLNVTQGKYIYGFGGNLKAEAKDGYTFLRWELTKGEGSFDDPAAAETYFNIGLGDVEITAVFTTAHTHAVCGEVVDGDDCAMANHSNHSDNVTFMPWDGSTELNLDSGEYYVYLVDDVTADQSIYIRNGAVLHLCLNGKNLTSGAVDAINVGNDCKFTLCDCVGTDDSTWGQINRQAGTYGRGIFSYGDVEIYGGHITGHDTRELRNNSDGGGICCWPGSNFKLYNGSITYNKAGFEGGGVYMWNGSPSANGDFIMYDGSICYNSTATDDGGGVILVGSHFIMNGGLIAYNTAANNGGGIWNGGIVTINDGGVAYNTAAKSGGGIYTFDTFPNALVYYVTMNGGYVGYNVAGQTAGGMNFGDGLFFSGEAAVAMNKAGTQDNLQESNILLNKGEQITVAGELTRLVLGSPEVLGITLAQDPTSAPVVYMKRADGSVTENDIAHTYSDAVFNDAAKAEFYNKRINADGLGEFAPNMYTLTLVNAKLSDNSTGGSFAKGTQINAVAVVPDGQVFIEWTAEGMTLTDEQKQNTALAFTMPANAVTLTAKCGSVVARVDDTEFTDFDEALSAWKNGTTLTLLANVSSDETVEVRPQSGSAKVLDLNGKTWTGTSGTMLWVYSNVTLTIKDSASGGCLKNADESAGNVVTVNNAGNLNFEGGKIAAIGANTSGIVGHLTSGTITISGGTLEVLGNSVASNGAVVVSGAPALNGGKAAFHLAGNGKVTIQAGTSIPQDGWLVYNDNISAGVIQGTNLVLPADYYLMDASGKLVTKLESGDSAYIKMHKHTIAYTADDVLDTIKYDCTCGYSEGSVKLVAPEGLLVYDGEAKPAAVEGNLTGYTLIYKQEDNVLSGEPTEVGTYQAVLALGGVDVSAEYTIYPAISDAKVYSVYSVTHYQEQPDGTYAEVAADTQFPLQAIVGDPVTATAKNYLGYTYNAEMSTDSAVLIEAKPGDDGQPVFTKLELYYTLNSYSVTFLSDGEEYVVLTQKYGTPITAPAAPEKAGWVFQGWDPQIPAAMPAENLTINALWALEELPVLSFTVTFVDYDGTVLKREVVVAGMGATAPAAPYRAGYVFIGWDKAFDNISADTTVQALYERTVAVQKPRIIFPTNEQIITVYEGERAEMSVVAENTVGYQWYVNYNDGTGWHRIGSNSPDFAIESAEMFHDGLCYVCVAMGADGSSAQSPTFILQVLKKIDVPQTGDGFNGELWMLIMLLSATVLFAMKRICQPVVADRSI